MKIKVVYTEELIINDEKAKADFKEYNYDKSLTLKQYIERLFSDYSSDNLEYDLGIEYLDYNRTATVIEEP